MSKKTFKVTEELLAPIGKRFLNFVIDLFVWSVLLSIVLIVFIGNTTKAPEEAKEIIDRFLSNRLWQYIATSSITLLYYNLFEIFTSRTVGKFCTNTIVVDENGNKVHYESIMIRSLIRIIPMYWMSFIIFPTRGLHDVISKTFVVDKRKLEEKKRQFHSMQNESESDND